MKSLFTSTLALAGLLLISGCATGRQVRTTRHFEAIDTIPGQSEKGYVEFSAASKDAVVPIFLYDNQRSPKLLAATGLRKGDYYSYAEHRTMVAEKVRVALSPGSHVFMLEQGGLVLSVPVESGKVTPVRIDYGLIYVADICYVYNPHARSYPPVPITQTGG